MQNCESVEQLCSLCDGMKWSGLFRKILKEKSTFYDLYIPDMRYLNFYHTYHSHLDILDETSLDTVEAPDGYRHLRAHTALQ
jgi:hypothetical protein